MSVRLFSRELTGLLDIIFYFILVFVIMVVYGTFPSQ